MPLQNEENRDILREIGNIGGGNALTSLSMMLERPLDLDIPECCIVRRDDAGDMLKNPNSLYAGVSLTMTGTVDCLLVLLMNKPFTRLVIETLREDEGGFDVASLTDMQKSALCEVGNIMGSSYITALGTLLGMRIDVSTPHIAVDTGRNVLRGFLNNHAVGTEQLLFVNTAFKTEDKMLESYMLLCPNDESLKAILEKLSL